MAKRVRRGQGKSSARPQAAGLGRWLRRGLWLLLALALLSWLPVLALRWLPPPGSAYMLARSLDYKAEGRSSRSIDYRWRDFDRISPWLGLSVIAAEDQRFASHRGFDFQEIERALAERRERGRVRGASTLSQQVARNLFLWSGQSYLRKGLEAWFTVLLEATLPKRRILEIHLNIAEFGDGIYGAEAASQRFFGLSAAELSPEQAALLAAVLPSPRRYRADAPTDFLRERVRWIQQQGRNLGGPGLLEAL